LYIPYLYTAGKGEGLSAADNLKLEGSRLAVMGILDVGDTDGLRNFLEAHRIDFLKAGRMELDFSGAPGMDTVPAAVIFEFISSLRRAGVRVTIENAADHVSRLFSSFEKNKGRAGVRKRLNGLHEHFEDLGESVFRFMQMMRGLWFFSVRTLDALLDMILHPGRIRWQMVLYYMEQSGVQAIPIVATLPWLLGTVLGYQAGFQMSAYGAEVYMPALLAYSITWEIGPMLAAVLVAGRSGSAFAAEIGTMQVRREVDALRVMGFDTFSYLVTPKLIALFFVMPFLVLLANTAGILGGLLAGGIFLDMPANIYFRGLSEALIPFDIFWGMIKAVVYAAIIANVGSYMGMQVRGGPAEVGRATTSAVVTSIFFVILADALMSLLFVHLRPGISV
jgi:phospholipid/cholesterol/gamma-HCH transport system permease protein